MKTILAVLLMLLPLEAFGACQIKGERVIACPSGRDAVTAYRAFGTDSARMTQSYTRPSWASGCFFIGTRTPVRQLSRSQVAFPDGWAGVTMIVVGSGAGLVADEYLVGKCERHTPHTSALQQDYQTPDYSLQ